MPLSPEDQVLQKYTNLALAAIPDGKCSIKLVGPASNGIEGDNRPVFCKIYHAADFPDDCGMKTDVVVILKGATILLTYETEVTRTEAPIGFVDGSEGYSMANLLFQLMDFEAVAYVVNTFIARDGTATDPYSPDPELEHMNNGEVAEKMGDSVNLSRWAIVMGAYQKKIEAVIGSDLSEDNKTTELDAIFSAWVAFVNDKEGVFASVEGAA